MAIANTKSLQLKIKGRKEKFIGPKPRKDTGRAHKMENLRSRIPGDGI